MVSSLSSGIRAGHLSYRCNPEGEYGHDCFDAEGNHVERGPVWSLESSHEAKPKEDWSEGERNASKFNAKALSVIF